VTEPYVLITKRMHFMLMLKTAMTLC